MAANQLTLSVTTTAPPDRVWKVLTDLESAPRTLSGVSRVEQLTDGPYRIGTRWRETRRMMGREETQELTVTDLQTLGSTRVEANTGGVRYVTTFDLEPTHPGTRLTMRFEAVPTDDASAWQRLARALVGRLGLRMVRSAMRQDLDDIVSAAEAA